jgi:hypothetical protein
MERNPGRMAIVDAGVRRVFTAVVLVLGAASLAGCANDDQSTVFILPSHSPTPATAAASASAKAPSPATSAPATPAPGLANTAATPIPGGDKIVIDSPNASSAIQSPVTVVGTASVDQGKVVVVVLGAGDAELGRAQTTASAASPDYGHFQVNVDFTGATPGTRGKIKAYGVGRDGVSPSWYYFITVRFP